MIPSELKVHGLMIHSQALLSDSSLIYTQSTLITHIATRLNQYTVYILLSLSLSLALSLSFSLTLSVCLYVCVCMSPHLWLSACVSLISVCSDITTEITSQ